MAAINIVIPFTLITWAELSVDSAIAAILNGAVPLLVIVLAALAFHDEPITLNRLVGVVVGYVGVIVLVVAGPRGRAGGSEFTGEVALLGSTRRLRRRRRVLAPQHQGPAADDPGGVPGRLRVRDGDGAGVRVREPARASRGTSTPSSRCSGSACSAPARPTC